MKENLKNFRSLVGIVAIMAIMAACSSRQETEQEVLENCRRLEQSLTTDWIRVPAKEGQLPTLVDLLRTRTLSPGDLERLEGSRGTYFIYIGSLGFLPNQTLIQYIGKKFVVEVNENGKTIVSPRQEWERRALGNGPPQNSDGMRRSWKSGEMETYNSFRFLILSHELDQAGTAYMSTTMDKLLPYSPKELLEAVLQDGGLYYIYPADGKHVYVCHIAKGKVIELMMNGDGIEWPLKKWLANNGMGE